jgi:DNA-binding transcriptional LysR family regulator
METYLASRHVVVSSPYSGHQLAEDSLTDLGISRKIIIRAPYYNTLPQLSEQSGLVVLLPSRIAKIFASQSAVVALPTPKELPEFDVKMHWHARHEANPAMKWLLHRVAAIGASL